MYLFISLEFPTTKVAETPSHHALASVSEFTLLETEIGDGSSSLFATVELN